MGACVREGGRTVDHDDPCPRRSSTSPRLYELQRVLGKRAPAAPSTTVSHSFIGRPLPASNGTPAPLAMSAATRPAGSFTTSRSPASMAKIEPPAVNAVEPNPRRDVGGRTPGRSVKSSARAANRACASTRAVHRVPGRPARTTRSWSSAAARVSASEARGVDTALPEVVRALARRAIARGHGGDGFSRVIEELRHPAT